MITTGDDSSITFGNKKFYIPVIFLNCIKTLFHYRKIVTEPEIGLRPFFVSIM